MLAAYSFEPQAREIIKEDVVKVLSALTLENAKKLLAALPEAFMAFQKLPADRQIEGAGKLIGNILVPLGIGAKGVQAGKSIAEAGIKTIKAGTAEIAEGGVKAALAGAMIIGGTAEVAMGATAMTGSTIVRGVGEL